MTELERMTDDLYGAVEKYVGARCAGLAEKVASLEEKLLAMPEPKQGEPGAKGEPGKDADPEPLLADLRERLNVMVAAIPAPVAGAKGEPGCPGPEGPRGREAAEIEPVPLDFERSSPRGTWASYAGGLWRSFRNTTPAPSSPFTAEGLLALGWEPMVSGIAAVRVEQGADERTFSVVVMRSSGENSVTEFVLPVMLHRGTWKPGEYRRGDVVTVGGSCWHAERQTSAEPRNPLSGENPEKADWKLIVKRGERGKDAEGRSVDEPARVVRLR